MILGRLLVVAGADEQEFVLDKETVTIGRAPDNDVVLSHPMISRHHARITFRPDAFIEDVGSALGTIVGGQNASSAYALHSGDTITIGDIHLRFESPQVEAPAARPVEHPPEPVARLVDVVEAPPPPTVQRSLPRSAPPPKAATSLVSRSARPP